jgi:hypothetical protein
MYVDFYFSVVRGQGYTGKNSQGFVMLQYVLICLSLALAGVAGLQFMYMFYLERMDRERRKRIQHLERECRYLRGDLLEAEARLAEKDETISSLSEKLIEVEEDVWADVIDDR